jgi:hypothetical protein
MSASRRFPRPALELLLVATIPALVACRAPEPSSAVPGETPAACEARQQALLSFIEGLPERSVHASRAIDLPESTLGAVPGNAPVIEISESALVLDSRPVAAGTLEERVAAVRTWAAAQPAVTGARASIYVAAARDTDVKTLRAYLAALPEAVEPRLLVGAVAHRSSREPGNAAGEAQVLVESLLAERDPAERRRLAEQGYRRFSSCAALGNAVEGVAALDAQRRWPALRSALATAVPACRCGELDTDSLERVIAAEQRAGASTLGLLPLAFLRDVRCGASMPLRSIGKLVQQMERFDREFSGQFGKDAVQFDDVLAKERLLGYFCGALPGETLAAEQRQRATLYLRRNGETCEGWRFEPLAPGAPMGTWRRVSGASAGPLAVHYWQAAEEIRLFGPADATKATDTRDWACDTTERLTGVDDHSVHLESGRWFFDEAACRSAPAEQARLTGCFTTLGELPPAAAPKAAPTRGQ